MSVGSIKKEFARAPHLGPERRRPQILDAALTLAAENGIRAVNMESVAQVLNVTKPVIYACFTSREDLLNALFAREEQRLFEGVISALPKKIDLSNPEKLMTDGFLALFKAADTNRDSWRLVLSSGSDPHVGARLQEGRRLVAVQVTQLARSWLMLRQANDVEKKVPVLVTLFMSICEGMVHSLLDDAHSWSVEELATYVGRRVLAAFEQA